MENIKEQKERQERIRELTQVLIDFLSESIVDEELPVVDAIFVFGHYDSRPAIQAAKLWKMGKAPKVIISGKGRDKIPSGFETEADFYASLIQKEGVPMSALILEKQSTNTLENVRFGVSEASDLHPTSFILCALPPLLRRSIATFKKQFPHVSVCGSAFEMSTDEFLAPVRLQRIISEFERLHDYAQKGDIVSVEITDSVQNALEELKKLLS
ncbi:MAG: hypothetical protein A2735_00335 [Candidatus Yanofskybacteria bacterium RIFCSPHIGHO2_01_FULL_41_21]|uniref:DUF218 domain-containing protein n=1 Tax=Candidatus Yanofskybacteria bacterium RIFCSPHIGHO2_01_FULL_41_21 TaxID=1802660 RepID=A0A1F8EBH3_9BACT|nr:MAG: hypothetical protein A2735_00335 [Candidatus Yanofskybacteria bacterium RIFCSPHIGHO2_01_FULL_41_21]